MNPRDDQRAAPPNDEELPSRQDGASSPKETNPWLVTGVAAVLGFEFVGFIIAGAVVGTYIDRRFETAPYGLLISMLLMLAGVGWHIWLMIRRFVLNGESS